MALIASFCLVSLADISNKNNNFFIGYWYLFIQIVMDIMGIFVSFVILGRIPLIFPIR